MRSLGCVLLALFWPALVNADNINISTVTKDGNSIFYLQAGAYNLQKDALARQKQLADKIKEPVEIKKIGHKNLFLVQVGPINDYPAARALKAKINDSKAENTIPSVHQPQPNSAPTPTNQVNTVNLETNTKIPDNSQLWNLRNADIRAVITEVSRVTGKNFIIDPRVQGKISIVSSTPMSNKELYQVFLSVLQVSGYAAIPNGDIIKIIPNIDAKTLSPDGINDLRNSPIGDDMMVAVIPVHYVSSEQLVPVLRPLMPQWSSVSAYAPSNMLILSGRANNVKNMAKIIQQVDSSSANGIDMVHLKYALAMDVTNTLKDLVKAQPNMNARTQLSIAGDDRSNSILISGSKTDRIRLRILILKLDRKSSEGLTSNTQVVYLHYLRAEDLVPILAGIATANFSGNVGTTIGTITRPALDSTNPASSLSNNSNSMTSTSSSSSSSTGSTGGAASFGSGDASGAASNTTSTSTKTEGTTKPTVQIIAEPNTNSIIINAPPSIIRILKTVITQLDIKPAQLLIEALVTEVNENNINDLGIEWGSNQQLASGTANFRNGFAIINSSTSISDFQAQLFALVREQKANILSTPSVVVLDNRQAKILIGKQVSIASTSYPNNAGGTTTASPFTTFDRVNVALHLYVRPQITRGDGIQMQIDQGNDTLDPASTNNTASNPVFNISSIVTSVHVESGDIVVLGGLTQDSLANGDNKLAILGSIPGVGRLFQRNITTRDKKVLMVFIKPIILRNSKDYLHVTGSKYNPVRQEQLSFLRQQETYDEGYGQTVLPPIKNAALPTPFGPPPQLPPPPASTK